MGKKKTNLQQEERTVTLDGMMTIGKLGTGQICVDFCNYELGVETEPFVGTFKGQGLRNGMMSFVQKPKHIRNKPIFRQDNSSLSKGRNGVYYFVFWLPEEQVRELPDKLVRQANEAAAKMNGEFYRQ